MSKYIKIITVLLISCINFLPGAMAQDAAVVKGASGFMIWGDKGWDGAGVFNLIITGCKTTYELIWDKNCKDEDCAYVTKVIIDWNKVNWKGGRFKTIYNSYELKNNNVFEAPYSWVAELPWMTHRCLFDEPNTVYENKGSLCPRNLAICDYSACVGMNTILFPITVALDRFESAAHDLMKECPGKKSKY